MSTRWELKGVRRWKQIMVKMGEGMRRKPYTEIGIKRIPCKRCGKPSRYQWQICATGGFWAGICAECDIKLNALAINFFKMPKRLATEYEERQRRCSGMGVEQ